MLGDIPVISPLFQTLLNGIGWVLAFLYDVIPNFGIAIIILTILIRVVLLPLGIKQIKSMQAMQAIQPKVKELQRKYKGNKQKAQEETMKLYREHGVNPLGGCLPLLLQFPLLVAMYAVVRPPSLLPVNTDGERPVPVVVVEGQERAAYVDQIDGYEVHNNHLPVDSDLFQNVVTHNDLDFLWLNLQCSAAQAGTSAQIIDTSRQPVEAGKPLLSDTGGEFPNNFQPLSEAKQDCGNSVAQKVPYFLFLAAMIGTTFFQQRQMQRASPPGASSSQQQVLLKVMPVMFGIFGFTFPSGLVVYWTTANFWQIGQQALLMKAGHIGPDALERRKKELADRPAKKKGLLSGLMERAQDERERRTPPKPASGSKPPVRKNPSSGGRKPSSGSRPTGGRKPPPGRKKPGGSSGSSNGKGRPNR